MTTPTDQSLYRTRPFTEFCEVSIEHLRRVWHADRGRLLLRTPGPVPLGFAYVLLVEKNPFPNLSLFFWTMLFKYPSVLPRFCFRNSHQFTNPLQRNKRNLAPSDALNTDNKFLQINPASYGKLSRGRNGNTIIVSKLWPGRETIQLILHGLVFVITHLTIFAYKIKLMRSIFHLFQNHAFIDIVFVSFVMYIQHVRFNERRVQRHWCLDRQQCWRVQWTNNKFTVDGFISIWYHFWFSWRFCPRNLMPIRIFSLFEHQESFQSTKICTLVHSD